MNKSNFGIGSKSICLPFDSEYHYQLCMQDKDAFIVFLNKNIKTYPELFPQAIAEGFKLNGFVESKKQKGFVMRRILLKKGGSYQIRPSFMMPYMIAKTTEVEKALYLRRWGVPFEALAYVFGRNSMFWYRAYVSLGRNSIVGTTIKDPDLLPEHLLADEKHTRIKKEKAFVATTVANECILGAGLTMSAGSAALIAGYGTFKEEACNLNPVYRPQTVNTDGWDGTKNAWKALFPGITLILCYLHSVLKITNRCKRSKELLAEIKDKVWNAYHADTLAQFGQRIRRFREWAQTIPIEQVKEKVLDLCKKAPEFKKSFSYPLAYRTSNALDRLMDYQDRMLYSMRYFHRNNHYSATLYLRAMSLIWNFHPYCLRARPQNKEVSYQASPFGELNGFYYHSNWLQNMLVAASIGGWKS